MNILLIGNGFDIAHGMKTRYGDFLDYCISYVNNDEFCGLIRDNLWIAYFNKRRNDIGANWIDFEKEIQRVVKSLEIFLKNIDKPDNLLNIKEWMDCGKSVRETFFKKGQSVERVLNQIPVMIGDLKRVVRALELYLLNEEEQLNVANKVPEIENLKDIHCVLSFNYTDTYRKIYGDKGKFCFVHGNVDVQHTLDTCNLVLGIDEYLSDEMKNSNLLFVDFKKYYQRIVKQTGADYLDWIQRIKEDENKYKAIVEAKKADIRTQNSIRNENMYISNLYIFGHSLDITDGDILREFICRDNVRTKIFYHVENEDKTLVKKRLIQNLIRVIGQDELIRRTGGDNKTIEFIQQSET